MRQLRTSLHIETSRRQASKGWLFFMSFLCQRPCASTVWLMLFFVFQGWLSKVLLLFLCFLNLFFIKNECGDFTHRNASSTGIQRFFYVFPLPASLRVVDRLINVFKVDCRRFCCCFYVSLIFFCQKRLPKRTCRPSKVDCFLCLSFASVLACRPFDCCCFLFFKVDCRRFCCCFIFP